MSTRSIQDFITSSSKARINNSQHFSNAWWHYQSSWALSPLRPRWIVQHKSNILCIAQHSPRTLTIFHNAIFSTFGPHAVWLRITGLPELLSGSWQRACTRDSENLNHTQDLGPHNHQLWMMWQLTLRKSHHWKQIIANERFNKK